ncbi:response regulator [Burkholderia plantarii]|uniref:response regulator n=1 Tax=Burkholderia plantarii TaxID=41899 RepID=UPI00209AFF0A|nr:response regulator [Burkholderia plantarii]
MRSEMTLSFFEHAEDDIVWWRSPDTIRSSHARMLVVDDDRDAAEAWQFLAQAMGFECLAVTNARQVCETVRRWQPFAVVLDVAMPGIDGCELARRLRVGADTRSAILIAWSGFTSAAAMANAREAGFDAHCAKPLAPSRVLAALRRAVDRDAGLHAR